MGHKSLRSLSGMQIQVYTFGKRSDHLGPFAKILEHMWTFGDSTPVNRNVSGEFLQDSNQWPQARPAIPSPSSNLKRKEKKLSTATSSAARYSITATRRWRPLYSSRSFWDGSKIVKKVCCHMYFIQLPIYIFYIWYMYAYAYIYIYIHDYTRAYMNGFVWK